MRELRAGAQRELDRAPELWIDFQQDEVVTAGARLEFDQAPSTILKIRYQTLSQLFDSLRFVGFDGDGRAAVDGPAQDLVVQAGGYDLPAIGQEAKADNARSIDDFLEQI